MKASVKYLSESCSRQRVSAYGCKWNDYRGPGRLIRERGQGQRIPVCKSGTVSGPPGRQSVTSSLIVLRPNQIKPKQNKISQTREPTPMLSSLLLLLFETWKPGGSVDTAGRARERQSWNGALKSPNPSPEAQQRKTTSPGSRMCCCPRVQPGRPEAGGQAR